MEPTELATTEILAMLLEQQERSLGILRGQAEQAIRAQGLELASVDWHGVARSVYDGLTRDLESALTRAARSLGEAETQTGRALATLGRRVG